MLSVCSSLARELVQVVARMTFLISIHRHGTSYGNDWHFQNSVKLQ